MHALRDVALRNRIDGVICFSTPFLVPTGDHAESFDETWAVLSPALLLGASPMVGVFLLTKQGTDNLIAALVTGALAGSATFILSLHAFIKLFDRFQRYARE
jgi:hypothetical protein